MKHEVIIYFRNGQQLAIWAEEIKEGGQSLILITSPSERTVVPLSAMQFYEVEEF